MKNKKIVLTLVISFTLLLTGCKAKDAVSDDSTSQNAETTASVKTELRIGMMSSYDVIPYVMMKEKGITDKYNLDLKLEVFTSAQDRDAAFQAGELDGVLTDYIGICIYQNAGFDVRITGITDGDYVLMAGKNSNITDISQIKGKSIAISQNTLIDYTLDNILEKNNYSSSDVIKEIVPRIPDRLELLRNDKIDLGLMPEPFAAIALSSGAVYLGSANDIGLYPAVSAFAKAVIDKKPEAVRDLYKAYNETVDYLNSTDISEYENTVIDAVGYPQEMKGQIKMEPFRKSALPSKEDVENAVKWAAGKGLCSEGLTYDQMVYDAYTE